MPLRPYYRNKTKEHREFSAYLIRLSVCFIRGNILESTDQVMRKVSIAQESIIYQYGHALKAVKDPHRYNVITNQLLLEFLEFIDLHKTTTFLLPAELQD